MGSDTSSFVRLEESSTNVTIPATFLSTLNKLSFHLPLHSSNKFGSGTSPESSTLGNQNWVIKSLFEPQHTQEFSSISFHAARTIRHQLAPDKVLKASAHFVGRLKQLSPSQCPLEVDGILTRRRTCWSRPPFNMQLPPFTMVSQSASSKSPKSAAIVRSVTFESGTVWVYGINSTAYLICNPR